MNAKQTKITLIIILTNLIIGNGILYFGGKNSFAEDINYQLMIGMSIACIIFYFVFFKSTKIQQFSNWKLFLVSILNCIIIILLGNFLTVLIKEPIDEVISNITATILMGIMANFILFPISLILGLQNFGIITYFKTQQNDKTK